MKIYCYDGVEDAQGRMGDVEYAVPDSTVVLEETDAADSSIGVRWSYDDGTCLVLGEFPS